MAEAMLRWIDSEHFETTSAGEIRGRVHPLSVEVLKEIGIDLERETRQSVQELPDAEFDYVITLGERAPSVHRNFGRAEIVHWRFDNPAASKDPERRLRDFRVARDQILQRLRLFVLVHARPLATPATLSLKAVTGATRS